MVIIGLGNPGARYAKNRHNIGYLFQDFLLERQGVGSPWREYKDLHYSVCRGASKTVFLRSTDYMNESGAGIHSYLKRQNIESRDILVVHDDLDLTLGTWKLSPGRGPQLHGGLRSLENHLGTKDFWRLRMGVDARDPEARIPGIEYVLMDFTPDESQRLPEVFRGAVEQLETNKLLALSS